MFNQVKSNFWNSNFKDIFFIVFPQGRGREEGEPGPSTPSPEGPALQAESSTIRLDQTGDNCNQVHRCSYRFNILRKLILGITIC